MKVAIHQPHYFPWLGYFDKLAKVDQLILLDEVQFEKGSQMIRNRVLDNNGEIKYLTIMGETKGFLEKKYNELDTKNNSLWQKKQMDSLENYYRKSKHKDEIMNIMDEFFKRNYGKIYEWTCGSITLVCQLLGIKTPLLFQSEIVYDRSCSRSDLVLSLCEAVKADIYYSGRGASVEYLNKKKFQEININIVFQEFTHPIYNQINAKTFIPGLSILDCLFNLGVDDAKNIFWENMQKEEV